VKKSDRLCQTGVTDLRSVKKENFLGTFHLWKLFNVTAQWQFVIMIPVCGSHLCSFLIDEDRVRGSTTVFFFYYLT